MPDARQIIEGFRQKGLDITGVNASGNIDYEFSSGTPDDKLLAQAAKYKPQLVEYFTMPVEKRTPTLLERMRDRAREGNEAINKRLEPDATKHPILNALYPSSMTSKALMSIPAAIGAATGVDESILGMMGIGAGVGAAAGAVEGGPMGAVEGAGQGLLSGLRLPGSKPSEKAIATMYDRNINQAVTDALGHLPNTVRALTKSGKKWWDVVRMGEHSGAGKVAGKEAGELYEKGMSDIQKKLNGWADQQVEKIESGWKAKHGFGLRSKPPEGFQVDENFIAELKSTKEEIVKLRNTGAKFRNTVRAISDNNKGVFQGVTAGKADPIKMGKTPAILGHEVDQMADKAQKLLNRVGQEIGEPLANQFQQLKDQYARFSAIRDMARHVAEKGPKTIRPGDTRVATEDMMNFFHIEREGMESRLKEHYKPIEQAILNKSDFSNGLDVEAKSGHFASVGGRIPGIPSWVRLPAFLKNPAIHVGEMPPGLISKNLANRGGGALGAQIGNVGRNVIGDVPSMLQNEEPIVEETP